MNKALIIGSLLLFSFVSVQAQKMIFSCDFEQGIPATFTSYDEDGNEPSRGMKKYGFEAGKAWVAYTEDAGTGVANGTAYSGSWYKVPGRSDDWLVTPEITVLNSQAILSWKAHAVDAAHPDGYAVYITDRGNKPGDFPAEPEFVVTKENAKWTEHSISLKKWAGKQVRIAFVNNSTDCNLLALDDIKVFVHDHSFIYISRIPDAISAPGEVKIKGGVTSSGFLPVEGYKVVLDYGGKTFVEDYSRKTVAPGDTAWFEFAETIPVALDETVGYTLSVSSGEADILVDENSITCFERVILAEEGTGNWCMYCPRGQVGMHLLREKYPDHFVDIAIHVNDPMQVTGYVAGLINYYAEGIPYCVMNRSSRHTGDPYNGVEELFLKALSEGPIAKVHCQATLLETGRIEVKAISEFGKAIEKGLYNLAFAVVEDSVTGYAQANAYSGGNEKIGGLEDLPDPIPAGEYYFANVARAVYPSFIGDEQAFANTAAPRTKITTERQYELPESVTEAKQVKIVAMIIHAATGEIVNVDECRLEIPSGIACQKTADEPVVKITREERGVLRIRTTDGSPVHSVELYTLDGKCMERLSPDGSSCLVNVARYDRIVIVKVTTIHGVVNRKVSL